MRRLILYAILILAACSCGQNGQNSQSGQKAGEAPELLRAVPSDALAVGVFSHCDKGLQAFVDQAVDLILLDYGKQVRNKAAIALCDVGTLTPLLVLETGRAEADTTAAVADLLAQADSLKLSTAIVSLDKHNALLLSPSATVIKVALRHLASETSILDAPYFASIEENGQDFIAYRNRGAGKLFSFGLQGVDPKKLTAFIRDAAEWTVVTGDRLRLVQPQTGKYFGNFLDSIEEAPSSFARICPAGAETIVAFPVASLKDRRSAYENWLDARVELEAYKDRIQALKKKAGKSPLVWEKEQDVLEVVYIATKDYSINLVRTAKSAKSDGVQKNPYAGFVRALYGEPFSAADSCFIRKGNWIISGERSVLDTLKLGAEKPESWPSKARAVVQNQDGRLTSINDNITIWHSNR